MEWMPLSNLKAKRSSHSSKSNRERVTGKSSHNNGGNGPCKLLCSRDGSEEEAEEGCRLFVLSEISLAVGDMSLQ